MSSFGMVFETFVFPIALAIHTEWPVWLIFDMRPAKRYGRGLPSGSMVVPFIMPSAVALTPVVNSPFSSAA